MGMMTKMMGKGEKTKTMTMTKRGDTMQDVMAGLRDSKKGGGGETLPGECPVCVCE